MLQRAFLPLAAAAHLYAQAPATSTLAGVVTDELGGAVARSRVVAAEVRTGFLRETLTGERGEFRLPLLPPGYYTVAVEKESFAAQTLGPFPLPLGQTLTLDFTLRVAGRTDSVEVAAAAPFIEAERTRQSNTLGPAEIANLPINRRDYLSFVLLAPGVVDSKALADATTFRVKQSVDSGLSFYGSNGRGNSITVDGGEANDGTGGVRPTVSQEAVEEFQVNRSNYSAEHGMARGGVVNILTRSGGNTWNGSAFAFFRHQSLDAGNPFAVALAGDVVRRVKPPGERQQLGATLGGPLRRDRDFAFFAYERLRRRESAAVPVLTDRRIFGPTPQQQVLLAGLAPDAAAPLARLLTAPASTIELFERNSGVFPFLTDDHKGLLRLDHHWGGRDWATFRFNATRSYDTNQNLAGLVGVTRGIVQDTLDANALAAWTRTVSPTLLNEARVQFNYDGLLTASSDPVGPAIEIPGYGFFHRDRFLPNMVITRRTELADTVSRVSGTHHWKLGAYTLIRYNSTDAATFMSGRFVFSPQPGALAHPALAGTALTALQSFNLGLPQAFQIGFGDGIVKATHPLYAAFAQDTFRPARNLTFDFGLRWEADSRKPPLPTNWFNFAPRFGFAWDPFRDRKTAVRGGYGVYFEPIIFPIDYVVNALNEIGGYRQIAQILTVGVDPADSASPFRVWRGLREQGVIGVPAPARSIRAEDLRQFGIIPAQRGPRPPRTVLFRNAEDYRNPYAQHFSFSLEREWAANVSLAASYIGVRGLKLTTSRDDNLLPAPVNPATGIRDWAGTAWFRDPALLQGNVYESSATSWYHGLIVEARGRLARGASLHANYTFSKAIDETVDYNSDFQPNDQTCRHCEKALSSFDQRHKLAVYALLQRGRWTLAPILRANSARPFNLLANIELNNDRHSTTDRPYGAGRNTGVGPAFRTFDLRLARTVPLGERRMLEWMAEAFNLFNHLNYTSVNNTVGNMPPPFRTTGRHDRTPSEPLGFTAAADGRRIQLGLRFRF